MDRACDHSAMRSVSHFQSFARSGGEKLEGSAILMVGMADH